MTEDALLERPQTVTSRRGMHLTVTQAPQSTSKSRGRESNPWTFTLLEQTSYHQTTSFYAQKFESRTTILRWCVSIWDYSSCMNIFALDCWLCIKKRDRLLKCIRVHLHRIKAIKWSKKPKVQFAFKILFEKTIIA